MIGSHSADLTNSVCRMFGLLDCLSMNQAACTSLPLKTLTTNSFQMYRLRILRYARFSDGNEDWTTPFMTTLSPNGGTCEEAKPSTSVSTTSSTTTTVATKTTTVTTTKDCNDNNPCTLDLWDPTNQSCIHTIKNCSSYSKYHQCDSKDGRCKPICTDNDLCTTDVWDPQLNSCSNTLVSCPANQSCDPADGVRVTKCWYLVLL
eukprot:CCRYP_020256-RM/>CCRYP_020256-RM protein AED:0.16 eAED:0.16 QI:2010/0.85/0.87/1/0.57/0.25/8/0/203